LYTATAFYQQPVVVAETALNVVAESGGGHTAVSPPASESPSTDLHNQRQRQQSTVDGSSDEDHYYSEISCEPSSTPSTAAAAASATATKTMTSSGHVTETDTPTTEERDTVPDEAVTEYLGLDTATISEPASSPSVYQSLSDTNALSSTSS